MALDIEMGRIVAVLLVATRLGALFLLTPLLGGFGIPPRVTVLLVLALSLTIVMGSGIQSASLPVSLADLAILAAREMAIGALLAYALLVAFSAFLFAGRLLDMQIGFGIANLIDPITRAPSPLLGTGLHLMAALVFFAVDGHHLVLRMLALSFQAHGPGAPLSWAVLEVAVMHFGMVFTWGLMLIVPALFALLLLDVALAFVSRAMPQMNVFIVAIPLKVVVGLTMLALSVAAMGPVIGRIFDSTAGFWRTVLD